MQLWKIKINIFVKYYEHERYNECGFPGWSVVWKLNVILHTISLFIATILTRRSLLLEIFLCTEITVLRPVSPMLKI